MNPVKNALIALVLAWSLQAQADTYSERETLSRLNHEIAALESMIAEAERRADPGAAPRFDYHRLRRELAEIRRRLRQHSTAPIPARKPLKQGRRG